MLCVGIIDCFVIILVLMLLFRKMVTTMLYFNVPLYECLIVGNVVIQDLSTQEHYVLL